MGKVTRKRHTAEFKARVRAVVAAMLAERGHMITEAMDAASALAILDSGPVVAVLVTDLASAGPRKFDRRECEAYSDQPRF